jgi:uncharacterized membrane protein YedE/YeeE
MTVAAFTDAAAPVARRRAVALVAGALFGAGLVVSGMTDPANVVGFLDFFHLGGRLGHWNPQLVGVMVGAIAVHAAFLLAWRASRARDGSAAPLIERRNDIDARLVTGAAIFGVGWGLAGYCPGPALVAVGQGGSAAAAFTVAMVVGLVLADRTVARGRASACGQ